MAIGFKKKLHFTIRLPGEKVVTTNHALAWRTMKRGPKAIPFSYRTDAYKEMAGAVGEQIGKYRGALKEEPYKASYIYRFPDTKYFFKNGNVRKVDLSNLHKPLEDCISEALDLDDKFAFALELRKEFQPEGVDRMEVQVVIETI